MSAPTLNIIDTLDDLGLFQPWFPGSSWNAWRVILKAAFGIKLDDDELETFHALAGDRAPPDRQVRELWIIAGRRAGKDSIASVIAAHVAAFFGHADRLRPGERALVLNLATDRDQAKICLNYVRAFFTSIPMLNSMVGRETGAGFELTNGVDIAIATNNFRAVRGRAVLAAILDECAFYQSESSTSPDVETYRALMPGLATLPGAILIGISSPYRRAGLLHQKYKDHFGRAGDVLVVKATSKMLNPTLDQAIIDQALIDDPAAAKAEWLGEFRDDVGGWLPSEVIEAAVDIGITVRPPRKDFRYVSFCDPSGGARDSFTAAVAHIENDVAVLDCLVEIKAPFNPTEACCTIAGVLKEYSLRDTIGDRYAAAWVTDGFARQGINYKHSERDRSAIYLDSMAAFNAGRVRLLDNRRMVTQFANLERRTSPIGKDRVDHGPGGHDDLCNSAAGALVQLAYRDWSQPGVAFWELFQREKKATEASTSGGHPPGPPQPIERTWAEGCVEWTLQQEGKGGPPPPHEKPAVSVGAGRDPNEESNEIINLVVRP
jgi:hypothetical protein